MDPAQDYYALLHVHPDAPLEVIKASYRTIMQRLKAHPDLGGDHDRAALLNLAYETLSDESRRAAYDAACATTDTPPPRRPTTTSKPRAPRQSNSRGVSCVFCRALVPAGSEDCGTCGVPTQRSVKGDELAERGRAIERMPKAALVSLRTSPQAAASTALTKDLSVRGMLIEIAESLPAGAIVAIDAESFKAAARVVHLRAAPAGYLIGLEFETVRFLRPKGTFVEARA